MQSGSQIVRNGRAASLLLIALAGGIASPPAVAQEAPASAPATSAAQPSVAGPDAVARVVLPLLGEQLRAGAQHDKEALARVRGELLKHCSRDDLLRPYRALLRKNPEKAAIFAEAALSNWSAAIAYYVDSLRLDQMSVGSGARRAAVSVPCGRDGSTHLRVICVRGDDGAWRVAGLAFEPPAARGAPTRSAPTATASAPTSAAAQP